MVKKIHYMNLFQQSGLKQSDWLTIRNGCGILIYPALEIFRQPDSIVQLVMHLTTDPEVTSRIPAHDHDTTEVIHPLSADSRRVFIIYWLKYWLTT